MTSEVAVLQSGDLRGTDFSLPQDSVPRTPLPQKYILYGPGPAHDIHVLSRSRTQKPA